jgi:hypothetical protein
MENHHAINGKIHCNWPFSIATLNYQRVILVPSYLKLATTTPWLFRLRLHFKAWPTFDEPLENGKQTRTMLYYMENIVKNHGTSSKQMAFIIHHMNNHIHRRLVVMNKQLAVYIYMGKL